MEAWVGIEPAYADLQSGEKPLNGADSEQISFRNSELIHRDKSLICKGSRSDCGTKNGALHAQQTSRHDARDQILPAKVTTYVSESGETMDRFALRIFRKTVHKTTALNAEVCGEFRRDGEFMVLDLYTIGEIEACSYVKTKSDAYTGISFHTHTARGIAWFTEEDYGHPGYMARGNALLFQSGKGTVRRLR